ncbi:divalent-cation tolerance protein CutA [Nibricoccus aquaticus]|uniref:Divalent-cation tolerance protein CutA n=1 Tax=Nibricoccus aquaticus TaxID=2576891 RepID=A0A290QLG0_9BACT|nr:divalent-cation tolerance protein CutA [Nibricoccus aquaticus]ATC65281.1 divalent-cation tolerance protein CutA [Nibricoccus aquaticus]
MLMIGWTTVATMPQAETLAAGLIESRLAACVQIEGPITSFYSWEGRTERSEEFRISIKFIATRESDIEKWLLTHHPYKTPEWITVRTENVSEKYLSWVKANTYN